MNVSLSPVNELGRVLHKFTCTAYEVADYSYDNLINFSILNNKLPTNYLSLWKTYNLEDYKMLAEDADVTFDENKNDVIEINFNVALTSFVIQDMMPGSIIKIFPTDNPLAIDIMIGATGSYTYDIENRYIGKI